MKNKVFAFASILIISISTLIGCGSKKSETVEIKGTYKQSNSNSSDSYQVAAIDEDTITVYWYTESDKTLALYWTGTFEGTSDNKAYSWESKNYHEITDVALLASGDDSKKFSYDKGQISYEVSMMGVTTTVVLEKADGVSASTQKPSASSDSSTGNVSGITVDNPTNSAGLSSSILEGTDIQGDEHSSGATQSVEEVSKQLDVKAEVTKDKQVVLFITNNSETVIDELDVKLNYVDANGMVIDQDSDGHDMILPGRTVVSKMDTPSSEFADAQVEYEVQLNVYPSYINHSDKVEISSNPGDDCVIVQVKNNDSVSIDEVEIIVLLYKGQELVTVTYPQDIYDLGAGQTTTEKISVYDCETYDNLKYGSDYDRIEVYLNQAHTFGF